VHAERGQSARIVVRVSVDIVVAVAEYGAAVRVDSSNIPCDHRMRDPKNATPLRQKSATGAVAGNDIAHYDGGGPAVERRERLDAETVVVGSHAIDDGDIERCGERARHGDSAAIIVRRDFAEHASDGRRSGAGGCDKDPPAADIGSNRIRHREAARYAGNDTDPDIAKIADDAVFDGEVSAGVEQDAVCATAKSLDGQPAQVNAVARPGIDRDGISRGSPDGRDPHPVIDDADRLGDGHRAIVGRIEHVDLAAGGGMGERKSKSPAGRGEGAGATIRAMSRNPSPVWSSLRWRGGKIEGEKSRGDGW